MKGALSGKKEADAFAAGLSYSEEGLVPVIAADVGTGETLMLAYADREAVKRTLASGEAWFFSRSRGSLWKKGETSDNRMRVRSVCVDCDSDTLLYKVEVRGEGKACHTGSRSCFVKKFGSDDGFSLEALDALISSRISEKKAGSYTVKLASSKKLAIEKIQEEAEELAEALERKGRREIIWEACDLIYHALVAVRARGITLADLETEFRKRHRKKR